MTCRPMETRARTMPIRPALGVIPPSIKSLHNSMRVAPPCCAATADATESTQTSISTCSAMGPVYKDRRESIQYSILIRNCANLPSPANGCRTVCAEKETPGLRRPLEARAFAGFISHRHRGADDACGHRPLASRSAKWSGARRHVGLWLRRADAANAIHRRLIRGHHHRLVRVDFAAATPLASAQGIFPSALQL